MKRILLLLAALTVAYGAGAQDTVRYWSHKGATGLNLSQVSLTNWSAGGEPSVAFDVSLAYSLDYKKGKSLWNNRLELAYGLSNTGSLGTRKTNDKIYLASTYGYRIAKSWYASATVNFNSQFANGYNYSTTPSTLISQFMAPGYLTTGVGFTWTPKKWFTATFAPAAWRGTFVLDDALSDAGAYGVKKGENLLTEFGANAVGELKYEFLPNMTVYSRLTLYSNYLENGQNVDVNWDTQLVMKINKWFSANAGVTMIYDDDTKFLKDERMMSLLQLKQLLGVGLLFNF